jgi:endonuclease-3 related protein
MLRHFGIPNDIRYDDLQKIFTASLPLNAKLFNEYHALIVCIGKKFCKKSGCDGNCPLIKNTYQMSSARARNTHAS